ncbi:MAG: hypothetical protein K6F77_07170, partial [Lachnospiraceae bacterium]|nr:hypothetical protein [Lachnospiraceae bacterium]
MRRRFKTITACALALTMAVNSPMADLSKGFGDGIVARVEAATDSKEEATSDDTATSTDGAVSKEGKSKGKKLYISELKIGNAFKNSEEGPTKDEVVASLEKEGFTVLKDASGNYADLNDGAGDADMIKRGPKEKIILLGYKTTEDPTDAITDLAMMNMNGGYSVQDYEAMMKQRMESQIKPFIK